MALDWRVDIAPGANPSADPTAYAWIDITQYARARITISRGRPDEAGQIPPSRCRLRLDNAGGRFVSRNVLAPWYPNLRRNCPLRVRVVINGVSYTRFTGFLDELPLRWAPGETDTYVDVTASGILRRLGQGSSPVRSPLFRFISTYNPVGYLPLEDGADATIPTSAVTGSAGQVTDVTFSADSTLRGSVVAARLNSAASEISMTCSPQTSGTAWSAVWLFKLPALAAAESTLLSIYTTGKVARWDINTGSLGDYWWRGYDASGTQIDSVNWGNGGVVPTKWVAMSLGLTQNGSDINWVGQWHAVDGGNTFFGTNNRTITGATIGRVTRVVVPGSAATAGSVYAHIGVAPSTFPFIGNGFGDAANGYVGEAPTNRITRLCAAEGVPVVTSSSPTLAMGAQRSDTLLNLLRECEATDGGVLYERLDGRLSYLPSLDRYNPPVALPLHYNQLAPPLEPTDDDKLIRNDVTATRTGGSSARYTNDAHVTANGRYDTQITVNPSTDAALIHHAGWRVHLGTRDEMRYPVIRLNLLDKPALYSPWLSSDITSRTTVDNLPDELIGQTVDQIIEGYDEVGDSVQWDVDLHCSPAGGWDVATADGPQRVAADGSTLSSSLSATGTALLIGSTTANGPWTTNPAAMPLDMRVGGERVTASAIGSVLPGTTPIVAPIDDAFSRTVSNGWGGLWSTSGGGPGDYAVNGSMGTHTVTAVASSRRTLIGPTSGDGDVTVTFATSALAVGAAQHVSIVMRHTDVDNMLMMQARLQTTQTVEARVITRIAAAESELVTAALVSGLTHQANGKLRMRAQALGTLFRVKIWDPTTPEPPVWNQTAIASTMTTTGQAGLRSYLFTGNTNTLPVTFSWDDVTATIPASVNDPRIDRLALPVWRAAAATAATTPVTVAVVGSSTAAGSMGSLGSATLRRGTTMWGAMVRARHNAATVPGGFGVSAANIGITNEWTRSGGANALNRGLGFTAYQLAAGNYIERPWYGTAVTILFEQGASVGQFNVSIDGGAATTVTPDPAAARNTGTWTSPTLTLGSHSVRITAVGTTVVEAVYGHDRDTTSGVRVWNGGLPGATTADLANTPGLATRLGQLKPSLVVLMLTGNDFGNGTDPVICKARIQSWLSDLFAAVSPVPDVLLVHQHQRFDVASPPFPWSAYGQMLKDVADADSRVFFVDVSSLFPTSQVADVWDVVDADNTHLTERGHQILSDALATAVAPFPASTQQVTLSARGVNGVSRVWPTGTEVDVWKPATVAL